MGNEHHAVKDQQPKQGQRPQKGKYDKLREGATRAERKEATFDELRDAAHRLEEAAGAMAEGGLALEERARSLDESARILTGASGDPAEYFRAMLKEGFAEAAGDAGFYGYAKSSIDELTGSARKALDAAGEAEAAVKRAYDEYRHSKDVRTITAAAVAASAVLAACCIALTATCFLELAPVFTGEVVVSYAPAYESELDRTRLELELARNELDAYRHQYPYGIGETAQADLDAANRAAQEAYDAGHAG